MSTSSEQARKYDLGLAQVFDCLLTVLTPLDFLIIYRKSLVTGTVPVNNFLFTGTVPVNNSLLTGTIFFSKKGERGRVGPKAQPPAQAYHCAWATYLSCFMHSVICLHIYLKSYYQVQKFRICCQLSRAAPLCRLGPPQ